MFRELLQNEFGITTEEILTDRIYCFFDQRNDGVIHEDEWIIGLSVLLKGTQEERIKYTFTIYDLNNDGYITKEEIFSLLRLINQTAVKLPSEVYIKYIFMFQKLFSKTSTR